MTNLDRATELAARLSEHAVHVESHTRAHHGPEFRSETFEEAAADVRAARDAILSLIAELREAWAERCYICRPGVPGVNEEGCSDCDERAGLHQAVAVLESELRRYREALEKARDELGVPGPGYPAPVVNAANIIAVALSSDPPAEKTQA